MKASDVDTTKPFLRVADIVVMTGFSSRSIWNWERDGTFPTALRKTRKTVVWRTTDVLMWIENNMGVSK